MANIPAAEHGFRSADDVDPEPRTAYRDHAARSYRAHGEHQVRYDSVPDFRAGNSVTESPSDGFGVVDVFVCTNTAASGTGVLLLDGRVVGAGDGRYQLRLRPGTYRLEVHGADASSADFSLAAGERVCFTTGHGVTVRRAPGFHTRLYRVRASADFLPAVNRDAARSAGLGCLMTVVGLVAVMVAGVWAALTGSVTAEVVAAVAVVLSTAGLVTGVAMGVRTAQRLQREVEASRVEVPRHAVARPSCLDGGAVGFPSPYDLARWEDRTRGAALVFDLFLYRVVRNPDGSTAYSGTSEALALAHAGPIRLWIDEVEVPADWATWLYPLSEGTHRFSVEYGPDELAGTAGHEFDLDVSGLCVVHIPVRVFRIWDEAERRLTGLPPQISRQA